MYKIYFKQAIEMLKQNKFISTITIIGTALAIMMIMVIIVSESIQNISVVPEANRDRTMYMRYEIKKTKDEKNMQSNGATSYEIYKNYLSDMKTPEFTSLIKSSWEKNQVTTAEDQSNIMNIKAKAVDANFWKLMSFSFIEGKPFTQEDFSSGLKKAVVTEKTAKALYGNENAMGKTIQIDYHPFTIIGIVKDVSPVFKHAYGEIYIPYTSYADYAENYYLIYFLAKDRQDFGAIVEEVRAAERKHDAIDAEWNLTLLGPYDHKTNIINDTNREPDTKGEMRKMILILSIFLLVPAINLSSFSMSQMKKRVEEIGVRKAYGAKRHVILMQVLYENFITSLIGGFIGLLLSYIVVIWLKDWLLGVDSSASLPLATFVSWPVFVAVFIVCILLNLISAGIPAFRASRTLIVDSLNKNTL